MKTVEKLGDIEEAVGAQDPLLPQDVYVHVDLKKIDHVIRNLISNAVRSFVASESVVV